MRGRPFLLLQALALVGALPPLPAPRERAAGEGLRGRPMGEGFVDDLAPFEATPGELTRPDYSEALPAHPPRPAKPRRPAPTPEGRAEKAARKAEAGRRKRAARGRRGRR